VAKPVYSVRGRRSKQQQNLGDTHTALVMGGGREFKL